MLTDTTHALMTMAEFQDLPEYSCTLPTGTTPGKRWKRSDVYELYAVGRQGPLCWWMGEYGAITPDPRGARFPDRIAVNWRRVLILEP